jgi:hypothetical protein
MKAITIHLPDDLEPSVCRAIVKAVHLASKAMTHGRDKGHQDSFKRDGYRLQLRHALGHLVRASLPWPWLSTDRASGNPHLFNAGARIIFALALHERATGSEGSA